MCSNGLPGVQSGQACCLVDCGACGGPDCALLGGGLGADNCCQSEIEDLGELCSMKMEAPCVVDDGEISSLWRAIGNQRARNQATPVMSSTTQLSVLLFQACSMCSSPCVRPLALPRSALESSPSQEILPHRPLLWSPQLRPMAVTVSPPLPSVS